MNKVMTAALIAGGLMLLNSPEAAAHKEVRNVYQPPAYYDSYTRIDVRRSRHMPYWLKRDRSFVHWYQRSPLKRDLRLAWHQLFDIYRWESRWGRTYYRSKNYWNDYYAYRYERDRHHKDRRHRH